MKYSHLIATFSIAALALTGCSAEELEQGTTTADDTEMIEVPDLVGMNLADAEDQLDELELKSDEQDISDDDKSVWNSDNWEVVEQDPAAGEQVEADTEILLSVQHLDDAVDEEEPSDEETSDEGSSDMPEPESPEHAVALATGDPEAEAALEPGESGNILFVTFNISDNFSSGLIASGAQRATFDALEELASSDIEYSRVFLQGYFPMSDQYGNTEDSMVLNAGYDAATVEQINFDNRAVQDTIWDIRDAGMVHQELEN